MATPLWDRPGSVSSGPGRASSHASRPREERGRRPAAPALTDAVKPSSQRLVPPTGSSLAVVTESVTGGAGQADRSVGVDPGQTRPRQVLGGHGHRLLGEARQDHQVAHRHRARVDQPEDAGAGCQRYEGVLLVVEDECGEGLSQLDEQPGALGARTVGTTDDMGVEAVRRMDLRGVTRALGQPACALPSRAGFRVRHRRPGRRIGAASAVSTRTTTRGQSRRT